MYLILIVKHFMLQFLPGAMESNDNSKSAKRARLSGNSSLVMYSRQFSNIFSTSNQIEMMFFLNTSE